MSPLVYGEGDPVSGRSQKIEKLLRLSEVKLDDYVGVIIPCMGSRRISVSENGYNGKGCCRKR